MRTRIIKDGTIVWFGSYGKNQDGTAKFYNDKKESYSIEQQNLVDNLTQRLSTLSKELWYRQSYGLPLFEKVKSKAYIDSIINSEILENADVIEILEYSSKLVNDNFSCRFKVLSVYGEVALDFNEDITVNYLS